MEAISLEEIEALARDESAKLQHFYIGVEHLFMALTRLEGGIAPSVLESVGQSAEYLRYATRDLAGRGEERRYWSGYLVTPRAAMVLETAKKYIDAGIHPVDCALLLAILEEGESIPVRVFQSANVDTEALWRATIEWSKEMRATLPLTVIQGGEELIPEQQAVLQQMFRKYPQIRIEQYFTKGFSGSTVLLVRPLHADGRSDALVVVKLYDRHAILWEKKRYDNFVRDRLPPKTARIEAEPTLPAHSSLGGLKYTFIRPGEEVQPVNLGQYAATQPDPEKVTRFLREGLFAGFRETWWGQARPYSFVAWQEYELLLPPALIVEALPPDPTSTTIRVLQPSGDWHYTERHPVPGEMVALEGFTVLKVKRETGVLQLVAGANPEAINYAARIDVHRLELSQPAHYRGELLPRLVGRVIRTRDDILQEQVQALEPDFNILDEALPPIEGIDRALPNPLRHYPHMLEQRVVGTLCTIHGDLHTGNILISSDRDASLIDFEWARDGHTLFDWAVLEISLLIDHVIQSVEGDWRSIRRLVTLLNQLNHQVAPQQSFAGVFRPLVEIRRIVAGLVANRDNWMEYHTALAFCALRVIGWNNRPLAARRLSFLVAALAMDAAENAKRVYLQTSSDLTLDQTTDQNFGSINPEG